MTKGTKKEVLVSTNERTEIGRHLNENGDP
jgi:hypothetical protein